MNDGLPGDIRFTVPNRIIINLRVYSLSGNSVYWYGCDGVLRQQKYTKNRIEKLFSDGFWVLVKPSITPSMTIKPFKI